MDIPKFKCCRKDFNNYICTGCLNAFHSSCLSRIKGIRELGNHKIYCSSKCEEQNKEEQLTVNKLECEINKLKQVIIKKDEIIEKLISEKEEQEVELNGEITKLVNEIKERENFYKKQTRNSQDFEDIAAEMERKLLDELTENKNLINNLRKMLNDVIKRIYLSRSKLKYIKNK